MSAYLLSLMKEDAARKIAAQPTRAIVGALITAAKASLRRGELSTTEFAQLGGYVFGIALSYGVIGENQALLGLRALRATVARAKNPKLNRRLGKKRSKKRGKKTRSRRARR